MQQSIYNESLKDKFTLSPLQKYKKYNRWPYKLFLAGFLVLLTSSQAIFVSQYFAYDNSQQLGVWNNLFLMSEDNEQEFLTITDFQENFNNTINNLVDLDDVSFQEVSTKYSSFKIFVNYFYPFQAYNKLHLNFTYDIDINNEISQPFNLQDVQSIKQFFQLSNGFTFLMKNISTIQVNTYICWDVIIKYVYHDYGYIQAKLDSFGGICNLAAPEHEEILENLKYRNLNDHQILITSYRIENPLLQVAVILTAILDMILNIKYIYEVIAIYSKNIYHQSRFKNVRAPDFKMKKDENLKTLKMILKEQKPWDKLSFREKLLFFDLFLPARILGNGFQLLGSGLILTQGYLRIGNLSNYDEIFVGLGALFAWFSLLKYLEYNQNLRIIVNVLQASIIPIILAFINFLPVFFAYTFLGLCLFNQSSRFSSPFNGMTTLYALVYADSLRDILQTMSMGKNYNLTMVYVTSFSILFLFLCNNIMISLIKEQLEQRKEMYEVEQQLMNEFDFKMKKKNNALLALTSSENESRRTMNQSVNYERRMSKQGSIMMTSVAKLAEILKKKKEDSGMKMSNKIIQQDWQKIAGQDMRRNYIYSALNITIDQVTQELNYLERDLWNDIEYFRFDEVDNRYLIRSYCLTLKSFNQSLDHLFQKACKIEVNWINAKRKYEK